MSENMAEAMERCENLSLSSETDEELRDQTLAEIDRLNVYAVLSGPADRVAEWRDMNPGRIFPARELMITPDTPSAATLASAHEQGDLVVLGEVLTQYQGILPDDEALEPYWAMAEENDIPVGIHMGVGPPGSPHLFGDYRTSHSDPRLLEPVLLRHPGLRVYVMHAGWPMRDELIAMLYSHPQLYVGTGVLQMAIPREAYYDYLEALVDAGFGKRIMFGSDQMIWPDMIEEGIRAIEEAPFLTEAQKRDILYNNAARFLRLSDEEISAHHHPE